MKTYTAKGESFFLKAANISLNFLFFLLKIVYNIMNNCIHFTRLFYY